jgi:hypothetical protein
VLTACVADPSVREAVAGVLRPDPDLAKFIRVEGSGSIGDGKAIIIARMWPNTKYIDTIVTGSMAQYVPTLNRYSGGLPIISMMYLEPELGHEGDGGVHQLLNGSYRRVEKQRQEVLRFYKATDFRSLPLCAAFAMLADMCAICCRLVVLAGGHMRAAAASTKSKRRHAGHRVCLR